jgi:GT2 family glycosyltransferase
MKKKDVIKVINENKIQPGNMITTCTLIDVPVFKHYKLWFDEEFFIYHEDISTTAFKDFMLCLYQPNVLAYHNVELDIKMFDKFRHYLMFRNAIIMYINRFDIIGMIQTFIESMKELKQPLYLKIRAILFGIKIGVFKLFGFYKNKIIDVREFRFVQKLSNKRAILR